MADVFQSMRSVSPANKQNSFDSIAAYEEHYMKLIKKYQPEIQAIADMMKSIRQERADFYEKLLPAIEKTMSDDNVMSNEAKMEWLSELRNCTEKSLEISEQLVNHYYTKNLEEFKNALQGAREGI